MSTSAGKFLLVGLVIVLIAVAISLFQSNQSLQHSEVVKPNQIFNSGRQATTQPLPDSSQSPDEMTPDQQALRRELEQLAASQAYKDMLARQARREQLTQADLDLLAKAGDIEGRMVKEPSALAKSTKYPPEDAKTQEMWQWWRKMKAADPNFEYKRPLSFYGKVVDEAGNPIPDVAVVASIAGPNGDKELNLKSDSNGLFKFEGQKGKFVTVDMDKRGYGRSPKSYGSFEYAEFFSERFHQADQSNPVIFVLPRLDP